MANSFNTNPIIVGTVMASSYKSQVAATLGSPFTLLVEKIYWENTPAAGYVRIYDPQSGNELASLYAPAAGSVLVDYTARPRLWQDFRVAQIDNGGLVKIYTLAG